MPEPIHPGTADRRHRLLVPLAALIAVLPLIVHGCSCGHDFDFHLLSWFEAATQIAHGTLHPQWAFSPAWNAGEPRFLFYPPLSWYLGAVLGLLLAHLPGVSPVQGWSAAPIVFTWIALTLSGLTMRRLARQFVPPHAALLAAVLYLANPYMLFTAYERTAYAELLAAAWIPLLLLAILRARPTILGIAAPLALLWLTNAPAAVIGSYGLACFAAMRLLQAKRTDATEAAPHAGQLARRRLAQQILAQQILGGTILGLALPAFYLVPAAYERRYVQIAMATIQGMRIEDNTLFHRTGDTGDLLLHDRVLHTASEVALLLLAATAIALLVGALRHLRRPTFRNGSLYACLALAAAAIALLLTPLSLPLWHHAPEAAFLQFPWRLLVLLAPICALAIALAAAPIVAGDRYPEPDRAALEEKQQQTPFGNDNKQERRIRSFAWAATAVGLLCLPAYRAFQQPCDLEDTVAARLAVYQSNAGSEPTDEYTPATADNDSLARSNPPYWLGDDDAQTAPADAPAGPAPGHLSFTLDDPKILILNLRDYPTWRITRNGMDVERDTATRPDGLLAIPLPAGRSAISVNTLRTRDATLGDGLTLTAIAILVMLLLRERLQWVRSTR